MADPLSIFVAGTALSAFGTYQANIAQAKAERENAAWLEQQAGYANESSKREQSIFARESDQLIGAQLAAFSSSGVDLVGSALDTIEETYRLAESEMDAIRLSGEMQVREALLKAGSARDTADTLSSPGLNLLQAGSSGLNAYASVYGVA